MRGVKAIILAAGEGTRMKSKYPKVLHKILGSTMIEHVIGATKDAGANAVCVVVGHMKDAVIGAIDDSDVTFVTQEKQLGTGHAVKIAESFIDDDSNILIAYGDTPLITGESLKKLVDTHIKKDNSVTFMTTKVENPTGYGRIERESGQFVCVVEHKDATEKQRKIDEINVGIYCFKAKQLKEALSELKNENAQKEYYLPDCISILMQKDYKVSPLLFDDASEFFGVNTKLELSVATDLMQKRINEHHMLNGVNIVSPGTVFIESGVTIGADTLILQGSIIQAGSVIGEDCVIGPNSTITNSKISNNCKIVSSVVVDAIMEAGSDCGPFSYLRPKTHLKEGVHVGDFVELKNVTIGKGTKVPHLTYVGDAEVGAGANLGCGTVTANYDGAKKFKTVIGDGAFIGCHTCLVAPVEVGKDAYTASGTVVTNNVPDGSLAIGRTKQTIKDGWRKKSGKKK